MQIVITTDIRVIIHIGGSTDNSSTKGKPVSGYAHNQNSAHALAISRGTEIPYPTYATPLVMMNLSVGFIGFEHVMK